MFAALMTPHPIHSTSEGEAASFKTCLELGSEWRDVSGKWVATVGPVFLALIVFMLQEFTTKTRGVWISAILMVTNTFQADGVIVTVLKDQQFFN